MTVKFAQRLFCVAGIYGMAVLTPMFFLEHLIGEQDPPPITHAEFYYGFVCTAFAWQVVYLMMWRDPLRFRPMLIPAILGKAGFAVSVFVLVARERLAVQNAVLPSTDLVLAALFAWAYLALGAHREQGTWKTAGAEQVAAAERPRD
jgi:cytochrome c oxidase subunit IV